MDGAAYQLHVKKIRALTRLDKLLWTKTNNMEKKYCNIRVSDFYVYIKFLMKIFYDQYGGDLKYTNNFVTQRHFHIAFYIQESKKYIIKFQD